MSKPIILVKYNLQWPDLYQYERKRILKTLGQKALAVEHIGSTSIPSLASKNIVDIMLGVQDSDDAEECLPKLKNIGYDDVTPEPGNPEWYYCLGTDLATSYCHLHIVKFQSSRWTNHLLFRDYLRTHPDLATQYDDLKNEFAQTFRNDRQAYTQAKASFITSVLEEGHKKTAYRS